METYQWFLLGVMVAFTPSLVVLGLLLVRCHDAGDDPASENLSRESYHGNHIVAASKPATRAAPRLCRSEQAER
jgi:hypothetical protein